MKMLRFKAPFLAGLLCSLLVPTSLQAADVFIPKGYSDFRSPGAIVVDRPMNVVLEQITEFPDISGEGDPRLKLKSYLDRADRLVIDVIESGLRDDSVRSFNRRFVFKQTADGKFQVWGYGYRQQCYRSGDPEEWVTDACL